jgi:hypothetical protein
MWGKGKNKFQERGRHVTEVRQVGVKYQLKSQLFTELLLMFIIIIIIIKKTKN